MRYAEIVECELCNGSGIGVSIWCTYCPIKCKNCCNKSVWDINSGQPFTDEVLERLIDYISKPWVDRISILGGEPLCKENAKDICDLLKVFRQRAETRDKNIWVYTGYWFENLNDEIKTNVLHYVDVLVDGPYIESQRDLTLAFRGSSNQRIIDIKASRDKWAAQENPDYSDPVLLNLDRA